MGRNLLCIFGKEEDVRKMGPDQAKLAVLPGLLQHAAARGSEYDCVSRSFAPKLKVPEDPVCGSGHCHSIRSLGNELTVYQASQRGGILYCRKDGNKVYMSGNAALFAIADLMI